jgi:nucleoside-diphosphate-sugar epimerase
MSKPTCLLTGSDGFVGRHFAARLKADGFDIEGCDIRRGMTEDCRRIFEGSTHYDLVVHCAAIVGGRAQIEGAPMAVADNLSIDAGLWQWALRTRPGRVVYFSSSAAYPIGFQTGERADVISDGRPFYRPADVPLAEEDIWLDDIDQPDATYGLAKLVGEVQAALIRDEGVPVTVVRPFSGYGSDQSTDYPFPMFVDRALARQDPFTVWGDGQQVRDWVHIDDVVDLTMACVDGGIDGPVNACTGRPTSFDDLATIVCREAGYMPDLHHVTDAPSGVRYRVGDPTLMETIHKPAVSLEDGVRRAMQER